MDFSDDFWKFDKFDMSFIVFLLFLMLCNVTFCADIENVDYEVVSGIYISNTSNYFASYNGLSVGYFKPEKGYIYHIYNASPSGRNLATSKEIPHLNGTYNFLYRLEGDNNVYDYLAVSDDLIYFDFSVVDASPSVITVTREKITNMGGVVSILSNDVGTNQFWNVFTFAIPFILVVVVFVFGFFIVRRLTKKESKGDIRF